MWRGWPVYMDIFDLHTDVCFFSNRQIERFINSPEAQANPPDYQDVLQQMLRANERYNLCLSRKQLNQMAKEAFREVGTLIQDRRHLDLVYNFGSHLTDSYKPGKGANSSFRGAQHLKTIKSNLINTGH